MDHLQQQKKWQKRQRKALGVRRRLRAAGTRPRLCVFRSSKHIAVQIIDDEQGRTLAAASTYEPALRERLAGRKKAEQAAVVGSVIAERATSLGVEKVMFDRGRYLFHGRVKALAEAARAAGMKF